MRVSFVSALILLLAAAGPVVAEQGMPPPARAPIADREAARARLVELGYDRVIWVKPRPDGSFEALVERDMRRFRRLVMPDGQVVGPGPARKS